MRRLFVALALTGFASGAFAGEYELPEMPILRGSTPYVPAPPTYSRWAGFYGGGQLGYSRGGIDFGGGVNSLVSYILRNTAIEPEVSSWSTLPKGDAGALNFGAFVGYNFQWDDIVLGLEANYGHSKLTKSASDSLSRTFINNAAAPPDHTYQYNMTVAGSAAVTITDMWTFRVRAGWVVDNFMPYAFVGGAVARADVTRSANVSGSRTDNFNVTEIVGFAPDGTPITITTPTSVTSTLILPGTLTQAESGAYTFGYAAGLGADYMLMQNVFVRGEWEFVQLPNVKGLRVNVNTVRTAVGLKF
jgi:opacity protein-like surface antigen